VILLPDDFRDLSRQHAEALVTHATDSARHCVVDCARVKRFDPGALGLLIRLQKVVRNSGRVLVLLHPTTRLRRALKFLRVDSFFATADDVDSARHLVAQLLELRQAPVELSTERDVDRLVWRGEITAANAQRVWSDTRTLLTLARQRDVVIDLSRVHFLDSSGVDVMLRARKLAMRAELSLSFANLKPEVWNVLRHARAENEVLAPLPRQTTRRLGFPELPQARPA
jgi:anti-anti-sigma factor